MAATSLDTQHRQARKAGIASFVGTTIEWYDFYAYSTAAALVLGKLFFPTTNALIGTLAAFASFWVGFLARPIGGIVFGHLGDKVGRKKTLIVTLMLMGGCTTLMGLLPTYNQVGVLAPVLLILLRLTQGIAMGGEWGGAVVLSSEHAPKGKEIFYSAFAQQGSPAGNLLATVAFLVISMLPDHQFMTWGWRVPFLMSAALVAVGLFIRMSVDESPAMKELQAKNKVAKLPIAEVLRHHKGLVAMGVGACVIALSATYFKTTFALSWAVTSIGFDRTQFLSVITFAIVVQLIVQPFGAVLATKMDLKKAIIYMLVPEIVALPLMFSMIATGSTKLAMIGMALASIPHSLYYAAMAGMLAKAFPAQVRYTGISLAYQICGMVFAGTTPILGQYLLSATGSILSVVALGVVHVLITLVCALMLVTRMQGEGTLEAQQAVTARV
ncbi:MFS transporter [Paraburkholderia acidiphila]|uniref:MFS transporter n=1 Tax=Paraburkholderia acidiphila TaxID=2571747 RepID=A0A7Z2G928_9BURK|nr:MFS transporter [Paraburkholderia acidiphila]QGZ57435.1 MFS transporter [Paraburkholderia acidiphila]